MMSPSVTPEQNDSVKSFKVLEARRNLRKLEMEAYASAVDVFRAQGVLTEEKLDILQKLCHHYQIPMERHFAELRRALSDDDLNEIAETLVGYDPSSSWMEEATKYIDLFKPFIPKSHFTANAFRAISNLYANSLIHSKLQAEESGTKSPEQVEEIREEVRVNTDHEYHCKMNPLASRILAESNTEEECSALSRSYLTPLGLEGLTEVFPDPSPDTLDNPPLSPSRDFFLETFTYGNGTRRGTEPNSLPSKRRRTTSEHRSVEESPSFEFKRSDKSIPSNTSKIMQDYQLLMANLRKKGKLPSEQQPPPDRRRGKGKRVESATQEPPSQAGEGKNISGLIVPCISIERIPISQPKCSTSPPAKQQKLDRPVMKGGRIKWRKKKLSKTTGKKGPSQEPAPPSPPAPAPAPVKRRKPIRVRSTSSRHSETAPASPEEEISPAKKADTSTPPPIPLAEIDTSVITVSLTTQLSTSEGTEAVLTQPQITCYSDDITNIAPLTEPGTEKGDDARESSPPKEADPLSPDTPLPSPRDAQIECMQSDIPISSPPPALPHTLPATLSYPASEVTGPLQPLFLEYPLSERILTRGRKDSSNSLDIPSPDRIKSGFQGLYSPISSTGTPPDRDRSAHMILASESTPISDQLIPRPLFSPITSPEESFSQSSVKSGANTSDQLSLVLQSPHVEILAGNRLSLALSDIVDEVCDSISDPLSHPSAEESKPFTPSTDIVFTNSSFMLSKALNSFIKQVIKDEDEEVPPEEEGGEKGSPSPNPPAAPDLDDILTGQELAPVEALDFAQISASLLSMEQQGGDPAEVSTPSPGSPPSQ